MSTFDELEKKSIVFLKKLSAVYLGLLGFFVIIFPQLIKILPTGLQAEIHCLIGLPPGDYWIYGFFLFLLSILLYILKEISPLSNSAEELTRSLKKNTEALETLQIKYMHLQEVVERRVQNIQDQLQNLEDLNIKILHEDDFKGDKSLFDALYGEFYAFNAPMIWETDPLCKDNALKIHENRYKNEAFIKAYYLYPIFEFLSVADRKSWANRLYTFFKKLEESKKLEQIHKDKLIFYLPAQLLYKDINSTNNGYQGIRENSNYTMTFFVGKRNFKDQLIYYQHNTQSFFKTDSSLPYYAFRIHHSKMCNDFIAGCHNLIPSETNPGILKKFTLQTFLKELKKIK